VVGHHPRVECPGPSPESVNRDHRGLFWRPVDALPLAERGSHRAKRASGRERAVHYSFHSVFGLPCRVTGAAGAGGCVHGEKPSGNLCEGLIVWISRENVG